jgi:hypothetical protein
MMLSQYLLMLLAYRQMDAILSLRITQQMTMRMTDLHHTTTHKERWRMILLIV